MFDGSREGRDGSLHLRHGIPNGLQGHDRWWRPPQNSVHVRQVSETLILLTLLSILRPDRT